MEYSADFEMLWAKYPRKQGKKMAFKHYKRLLKEGYSHNELVNAVENYSDFCEREGRERKYIKKGVNFLRHGDFEDYILNQEQNTTAVDINQATDYYIELTLNFDNNKDLIKAELRDYKNKNNFTYSAYRFIEKKLKEE